MENFSREQAPARRSVEELARLQRQHEEAELRRIEEERQATQAKAALAAGAEEDLARRPEILARISALREAMNAMGGIEAMQQRIRASQNLKEAEETRVGELEPIQLRLEDATKRIRAIQDIIEGATLGVAPELADALKDEQATAKAIEQELTPLVAEIQRLQASQISPDQLTEYERMRSEMAGLVEQMNEIEGQPVIKTVDGEQVKVMEGIVNERLINEAETEEQVRETIIREAMRQIERWDTNDPKVQFVRELCERFLSEEFEASGITATPDDRVRGEALKEFMHGIMNGMEISMERTADEAPSVEGQKLLYKGLLLKCLIGKYGATSTIVRLLRNSEIGGYTSRKFPQELADALSLALRKHLGTLNFMRGTAAGLSTPDHKRAVVTRSDWQGFDNDYDGFSGSKFVAPSPNEPIFPRDADEVTRVAIREAFAQDKEKARKTEEALVVKDQQELESRNKKLQAEIIEAEAELAKLQAALQRVKEAEASVSRIGEKAEREHGLYKDIQTSLNVVQTDLSREQRLLREAAEDRGNTGFFNFPAKKILTESIKSHEVEIARLSALLRTVEQLNVEMKEATEIIRQEQSSYNLSLAIRDFEAKLGRLRNEIQAVQSKLAQTT